MGPHPRHDGAVGPLRGGRGRPRLPALDAGTPRARDIRSSRGAARRSRRPPARRRRGGTAGEPRGGALPPLRGDLQAAERRCRLVHIARDVPRTHLSIVGAYRDGRPGPALADALAQLVREPSFERIELAGLSGEEVARLVEGAAGHRPPDALVAAIHEQTAGNPFFVGEVVRALAETGRLDDAPHRRLETVPSGVRAVVAQRLRRLSAPAVAALEAASVLGRTVRPEVLAGTLGARRDATLEALREAAEAQLMLEDPADPGRYRFAHAIVRDVVYAELPPAQRARLHGAAAATLEARIRAGVEHDHGELAHHFLQAAHGGGPAEPAVAHARRAAARALDLLAYAEAADHFERALGAMELLDAPDAAERCALLIDLADARTRAFQSDEGRGHFARAAELARELGSPELFARAALGFAEWAQYGEVDRPAIALLEEALALLPEDDGPLRAAALGRLAIRLDPGVDQPRREALLGDAIAMARRLGDPAVLARLLALGPILHWQPESVDVRRRAAEETIALADAGADLEGALWACIIRFADLLGLGAISEADAALADYAARAAALRQPYYRWYLMVLRAARALFAGRLEEGERLATEAVTLNRRYEPDGDQEFAVQAYVLARMRGDRLADGDVAILLGLVERYAGLLLWDALGAHVAWALGREDEARRRLRSCVSETEVTVARDADWIGALTLLAEVCAGLGDRRRAAVLGAALAPYAERNALTERAWAAWGSVARRLGELAATHGDMDAAAAHFECALALERRWEAWPWVVHTLRAYAAALPDAVGAAARHDEAAALARRLGVRP
jgi:hypothetical protein